MGYHLDQAHRYRLEISPGDQGAAALATRAGGWLAEAGRRALGRRDLAAAASLLGRASVLLPPEAPERLQLLPDLAAAVGETGRVSDAREHLREAIDRAAVSGDRRVGARARVAEAWWRMSADNAEAAEVEPSIREAIGTLEELGDEYGLASAWRTLGDAYNVRAEAQAWSDCLLRAFDYARRSGNRHEELVSLAIYSGAMFYGPTPAQEGVDRLTAVREEIGDDVLLEGAVLRALGGFVAMTGDVDEGRRLVYRSREIVSEVGMRWLLAGVPFMSGAVELLAGDLAAAEREYRSGIAEYERMGERARASTLVANLANVLCAQARYDEAGELARLASDLGGEDDVVTQCAATAVRAKLLAHSGDAEEAMSSAADAWQMIARSDFINWIADTAADVAEVHELTGGPEEATRFRQIALEFYERKGNVVMAERTRALLGQV